MVIVCLPARLSAPQGSFVYNLNVLHSAFLKVSVIVINKQTISNRLVEEEKKKKGKTSLGSGKSIENAVAF